MKNLLNLILILGLAFMLTGCPPKETTPPEAEETTPVSVEEKKSTMTLDDLEDEGEISEEQRLEDETAKDTAVQRKKLIKELAVKDPPPPPTTPPAPKKVIKERKPKPTRGTSIPYDENRFTIQVGSKKELADAKTVAAKLIDAGYDAYIQKAVFKETNEIWYRIRVGSYDKRETATAVAKSLSKTQKESAWVDFVRYEY